MARLSLKTTETELRHWYKNFLQVRAESASRADMIKNPEFVAYFVKCVTKSSELTSDKVELDLVD